MTNDSVRTAEAGLGPLTATDLEAIGEAVHQAELRTSGEIVTYIVGRSDPHPEAAWRGAAIGAVTGVIVALAWHRWMGFWGGDPLVWGSLPTLVGLLLGFGLVRAVPALERRLCGRAVVERRVGLRAEAAFLEEEVFRTRDRTGILIFVSLFEHRAVILGDEGIHQQVGEEAWVSIVADLVGGLRARQYREALITAVDRCGRLLENRDLTRREDDIDELPDQPRVRDS